MAEKKVNELKPGMRLSRPVHKQDGAVLLDAGIVLTKAHIEKLRLFEVKTVHIIDEKTESSSVKKTVHLSPRVRQAKAPSDMASPQRFTRFKLESFRAHHKNIENIRNIFSAFQLSEVIDTRVVKEIVDTILTHVIKNENVMISLTNLKTFDNYLYAHSVNVGILSLIIGKAMGLPKKEQEILGTAALLHDIGMLKIPRELIDQPRRLTQSEMLEIQKHPIYGYNYILEKTNFSKDVAYAVYHHHERMDGSGYPNGLKGNFINKYARIIAIADTYEAMVSPRVYREMYLSYSAMKYIVSHATNIFDANALKAFVSTLALHPVGSLVRLQSGELAIVIKANKQFPVRPIIKIVTDTEGNRLEKPLIVDLLKSPDLVIKEAVDPSTVDINIIKEF